MTEPWQPPEYRPIYIRQGYTDNECDRCGAAVTDFIKHNRFHANLDTLNGGVIGLTQIIVPDLPHGMLLTPRIPVPIRIRIGRGGGGSDSNIPECPLCHAYGGGGHGGGCPNSDRPVEQWTSELE